MKRQDAGECRAVCLAGLLVAALLVLGACAGPATPAPSEIARPPDPAPVSDADRPAGGTDAESEDIGFLSLQEYYARRPGQPIKFEHISSAQGLPGAVYWITQDSVGFLWIGTSEGLHRYDGRTFQSYRHDPDDPNSLSEDHVFNILEDSQGNLWVATYGGGLERFDRDQRSFIHYQFDPDNPRSLGHNKVFAIFEDREGELWIGTSGGGLDRYDRETDGFVHHVHDPEDPDSLIGDYVNAIYQDRAGDLWIGTTSGLDRLDRETGSFTHYRHDPEDPGSLGHDHVFSILEDQKGILWIGTSGGGLDRFDRDTETFIHYRHDPADPGSLSDDVAFVLLEDGSGTLWVGSLGGGLNQFDRENEQFIRYQHDPDEPGSLSNDYVNAMFEDREGILWIGTTHMLDKYALQKERFDQFLGFEHVMSILETRDESVWVGTVDGLYRLDSELDQVAFYQHDPEVSTSLSKGWVMALYEDSAGTLWVGVSGGGLDRFDPATERFDHHMHDPSDSSSLSNDVVNVIYEDRSGALWVGTDGGLNQFDRRQETFRLMPTSPESPGSERVESVGSILADSQGILWAGTLGDGLKRYDRETGQFSSYRHDSNDANSLKTNFVTSLFEDSEGGLWVGTDGGLHLYDPLADGFQLYGEDQGLQYKGIGTILQDHRGALWLATGVGLTQFDTHSGTLTNYDSGDGLRANGGWDVGIKRASGEMLFGGVDGIDSFYPERILPNPYVPPVAWVSLRQDGQEVDLDQALDTVTDVRFAWPRNDFEFEFTALSYTEPDKNQHAYKLEGYDQDWNYLGTGRAGRYTNLPGGSYTLRLKGTNDDGVWNQQGLAIQVVIVPPLWETWWFVGTVALVLVGSVFVGYRLRVRSVEARSSELEAQVDERTAELSRINELLSLEIVERQRAEEALAHRAAEAAVLEERSRLARELHDAVTQTLFSASLIAETLPDMWEHEPEEGRQLLRELLQLNRGAMAEMRTLLMELRPTALIEANLGDLVRQFGEAVTGRTGVPVAVKVESCREPADQVPRLPSEVHVALYRIAQEALNNVVKHAEAQNVEVNLYCTSTASKDGPGEAVVLFIRDDGCGFDPEEVSPDRLGLGIIRERAQKIGAKYKIESEPGIGTQILVVWTGEGSQDLL